MAGGKPAGLSCAQLDAGFGCAIFGQQQRPRCCAGLKPSAEMCGDSRKQALAYLERLERLTA